ncbi:36147_t:CDS:1, partial [Gigaspora margarita]
LQDMFTNDDNYLKHTQKFNIKHKELLKNEENYMELENINLEEKTIKLISIAYNLKQLLFHLKEKVFLLKPETPNQDKINGKNILQELKEEILKYYQEIFLN